MKSEVFNQDCMEGMKQYPDKYFDLAVVDPPYGIGFGKFNRTNTDSAGNTYKADKYKNGEWDSATPTDEYWEQLFRVSKNQIVWGGNYFPQLWDKGCRGFIFWHKGNPVENFADGELAWTSFDRVAKQFDFRYYGGLQGEIKSDPKIHPTQKPLELYKWVYATYLRGGGKVLDTHLGSGSSRIAANKAGNIEFTGYELDKDYFDAQEKRYSEFIAQLRMF